MKEGDIWDTESCWGPEHEQAFKALPEGIQKIIEKAQKTIQAAVEQLNPGVYKPTSGFRSPRGNMAVGGMVNSRHLVGMARDFVALKEGPHFKKPHLPGCRFKIIKSPKCWHIEITRLGMEQA